MHTAAPPPPPQQPQCSARSLPSHKRCSPPPTSRATPQRLKRRRDGGLQHRTATATYSVPATHTAHICLQCLVSASVPRRAAAQHWEGSLQSSSTASFARCAWQRPGRMGAGRVPRPHPRPGQPSCTRTRTRLLGPIPVTAPLRVCAACGCAAHQPGWKCPVRPAVSVPGAECACMCMCM